MGVSPGRRGKGWSASIRAQLLPLLPADLEHIDNWAHPFRAADAVPGADYLLGVRLTFDVALGDSELADEVERVAAALQPVFDRVMALAGSADQAANRTVAPSDGLVCLLYKSPSPRDRTRSRMPSSA